MIPPHTKAIPLTPLRGPQARRGIFLPTRPAVESHTFAGSHPVFLSKYRLHPFACPTGGGIAHVCWFAPGFPQQVPPAPFLPARPVAESHTFAGSHPVFLSEHLQLPFPPLRPTNTNLISKTRQPMDGQHVFLLPIHGLSFSFILRRRCPARSPRR